MSARIICTALILLAYHEGGAASPTAGVPAPGQGWDVKAVPPQLHRLFGLGEGASYGTQMEAAAALPAALTEAEVEWLYAFLRWRGDGRQESLRLNAVKNDISCAIQRCQPQRRDYGPLLVELCRSPDQEDVWRDYCLQHIGDWYASDSETHRAAMRGAMWDAAATGTTGSLAGTALIALRKNIGRDGITREAVCDAAHGMVTNVVAGSLARITALQICATLGDARALAPARALTASSDDFCLRASAIAAVGYLGTARDDGERLQQLAASSDVRLRVPARAALARLAKSSVRPVPAEHIP